MSTVLSLSTESNSKFLSKMTLNEVPKKEEKSLSLSDIGIAKDSSGEVLQEQLEALDVAELASLVHGGGLGMRGIHSLRVKGT